MAKSSCTRIAQILQKNEADICKQWVGEQSKIRPDLIRADEIRALCGDFVRAFRDALLSGSPDRMEGDSWSELRKMLAEMSQSRSAQGFSPSETAMFVFSFKNALFDRVRKELGTDPEAMNAEIWIVTEVLDRLGLWTFESFQKAREAVINRQQEDMLELSTPVVKLWDGILALPIIGTLDSARSQVVMESLLQKVVETGSDIAIIDITGVPTVDTLTAQHLIKTVTAARLMGADCIISGIRPQIAQTLVHLGVDLNTVITKAGLADAFALALKRRGMSVVRNGEARPVP